jgi:predicted proteasome-type protease
MYQNWLEDKNKYIREAQRYAKQLEEMLQAEKEESIHESDSAWDIVTLREEVKEMVAKATNKEEK